MDYNISRVKNIIDSSLANMMPLDAIENIQATLRCPRTKDQALHPVVQVHQRLPSPICRVPPEIMSMIFIECLGEFKYHKAEQAWVLGWVCRYWRDVAFSTPRLWSKPTFRLHESRSGNDVTMAKEWLARAGSSPLRLSVEGSWETAHAVLDAGVDQSHVWKDFSYRLSFRLLQHLSPIKNRLPRLERLTFRPMGPKSLTEKVDVFEDAPRLRHLSLGPNVCASQLNLPWPQLKSFSTAGACDIVSLCDTFQMCPNLVECEVDLAVSPSRISRSPVRLEHLETMRVRGESLQANFFDYLELPALRTLHIEFTDAAKYQSSAVKDLPHHWIPRLISLIKRSSCPLSQLDMKGSFEKGHLMRLLEVTPTLQELKIRGGTLADSDVQRLTHRVSPDVSATAVLAPNLTVLEVNCLHSSAFDFEAFAEMIRSRTTCQSPEIVRIQRGPISLRSICLSLPLDHSMSLSPLQLLKTERLDLNVVDSKSGQVLL